MTGPSALLLGLGKEAGEAIARRFVETGVQTLAADARSGDAAPALPDAVPLIQADVATRLGLRNALASAYETHGRLDHVVCVPRLPEPASLEAFDEDLFDESVASVLRGAVLAIALAAERMAEQEPLQNAGVERTRQSGSITFVLSMRAIQADPGRFTEAIAQGAILSAVRASALELAPKRIRVNAIVAVRPRAEDTETWLAQRTPFGRAALADEIAEAALYLSSPSSAIATGSVLTLDGGRCALGGIVDPV